ncbi:MAG TPA: ATP-binding protein [Caulobacteraceae bacterium]|nr:ATP-binding protein [Caulobacteraceae bacterium]
MLKLLDHRFDAFAAETHENLVARAAVAVGAGAAALMLLPWRVCAIWTVALLAYELWGWFATRQQYLGRAVSFSERLGFAAYLVCLIACWFLLGMGFWLTGRMDGAVCAAIVWVSVIGFAQTFSSRTPLGFAICGVTPAVGVLTLMLAGPTPPGLTLAPVMAIMALCVAFAIAGARQTFAAGRRLEETQALLLDSEADYRVLADNIADVIGRLSVQGRWRYISPSIEATLGYTADEFRALQAPEFIHADDLPAVLELIAALSDHGGSATLEYRQIAKDGSLVWIETSFTVAYDEATHEPVEVICLSREINARKALEHDLVEALQRAEAAAAAKADFMANMTHELRTPLNAIIGFSGVLKGSVDLTSRDARHVGLIGEASGALLTVVNDVLDFSKLESGAFELDPQPFDPLALAGSVAALVEDQAAAQGLTLEVIADGAVEPVSGDGPRLRQVLLNLLSNALKFTTQGGVTLRLAQQPAGNGDVALRVSVTDTGIGISPENQVAVFERFNQADASVSRRFGGTGLGLAICKRIVELMGGTIGVQSREGRGSTFWIELQLPLAVGALAPDAELAVAELDRPLRLLLVEDVAVNRELVRVILESFDIEIDTATNGAEAIDAVGRAVYDLVLMDVQMPVMDGLTAAAHIRALPDAALRRLPIIAMTANVLPEQVQRCLDAGMNSHLGKPINPAALLEAIAAWTAPDAAEALARDVG